MDHPGSDFIEGIERILLETFLEIGVSRELAAIGSEKAAGRTRKHFGGESVYIPMGRGFKRIEADGMRSRGFRTKIMKATAPDRLKLEHVGDAAALLFARLYILERLPQLLPREWQAATSVWVSNATLNRIAEAEGIVPFGGKKSAAASGIEAMLGEILVTEGFNAAKQLFFAWLDRHLEAGRRGGFRGELPARSEAALLTPRTPTLGGRTATRTPSPSE